MADSKRDYYEVYRRPDAMRTMRRVKEGIPRAGEEIPTRTAIPETRRSEKQSLRKPRRRTAVLSDAQKRQQYDQFGHAASSRAAQAEPVAAGGFDFGDMGDIFGDIFGGGDIFGDLFGGGRRT